MRQVMCRTETYRKREQIVWAFAIFTPQLEARHRMKERQTGDGYKLSQKCRKKIEEVFGWLKEVAGMGRSRWVGRWKLQQVLKLSAAAFNLVRMRKLAPVGRGW